MGSSPFDAVDVDEAVDVEGMSPAEARKARKARQEAREAARLQRLGMKAASRRCLGDGDDGVVAESREERIARAAAARRRAAEATSKPDGGKSPDSSANKESADGTNDKEDDEKKASTEKDCEMRGEPKPRDARNDKKHKNLSRTESAAGKYAGKKEKGHSRKESVDKKAERKANRLARKESKDGKHAGQAGKEFSRAESVDEKAERSCAESVGEKAERKAKRLALRESTDGKLFGKKGKGLRRMESADEKAERKARRLARKESTDEQGRKRRRPPASDGASSDSSSSEGESSSSSAASSSSSSGSTSADPKRSRSPSPEAMAIAKMLAEGPKSSFAWERPMPIMPVEEFNKPKSASPIPLALIMAGHRTSSTPGETHVGLTADIAATTKGSTPAEVENFLSMAVVDPGVAGQMRALPPQLQRIIIERGPITAGTRNPSWVLQKRIHDAESGRSAAQLGAGMRDAPTTPGINTDPGIEKMIQEFNLDVRASTMLRCLPPDQRALALELNLADARNPSQFVVSQISQGLSRGRGYMPRDATRDAMMSQMGVTGFRPMR